MIVYQDLTKGNGYKLPLQGTLDPISYDFKVTVDPCRIGRYEVDVEPEPLEFMIGGQSVTGGNYNFAEILSSCGYPQEVTLQGLPDFVTHNEESQDFTIESVDDVSLAGTYRIQITSTIKAPTSATDPTLIIVTASTEFELELIDPCQVTEMLPWLLESVTVQFNDQKPAEVVLAEATD